MDEQQSVANDINKILRGFESMSNKLEDLSSRVQRMEEELQKIQKNQPEFPLFSAEESKEIPFDQNLGLPEMPFDKNLGLPEIPFDQNLGLPDFPENFKDLKVFREWKKCVDSRFKVESCPLLEDLSLLNCCTPSGSLVIASPKLKNLRIEKHEIIPDPEVDDMLDCLRLKISCPNLELLKLVGPVSFKFSFRDLHSLKKSMIHCTDFSSESFCDVFNGISHVEYLSISICFIGQCYWPDEDEEPMSLPNLKTLEITVDDPQGLYMIITFLEYFPDLESLHLIFIKHVYGLNKWHLQEAEKINILTRRLKKVEFCEFDDEKPILVVARALLEHGKELEEMVFSWGDEAKFHEMSSETMNQVSNFRKVSSTVKLRFVINPSQADP